MLLDFPDTIFGNCAPHKLPLSQNKHLIIYFYYIIKIPLLFFFKLVQ